MKRLTTCVLVLCLAASAAWAGGSECVGDVDGDGQTGIFDFLGVLGALGTDCSAEPCDEDVDGNGVVGIEDFFAVLMDFGCGAATCESHGDCDDGDDCTYDLCLGGTCLNIPICP